MFNKRTLHLVLMAVLVNLVSVSGCSSHVEKTETTVVTEDNETGRVVTEKTTIKEDDDDDNDGGLFSIVGDIIALPFRAVGALLSAIF